MHLHVVMAFALLIWWPRERPIDPIITSSVAVWTAVLGQLAIAWTLAWVASVADLRAMRTHPNGAHHAQRGHHRRVLLLRGYVLATFVVDLALTRWPDMIAAFAPIARVPALAELIIIAPFLLGSVLLLVATYPTDRVLRGFVEDQATVKIAEPCPRWSMWSYLDFNIRHQLLIVVVPMTLILLAYDVARDYEDRMGDSLRVPWLPDLALGVAAAAVFIVAPLLMKRIWTTHSLPTGALRDKLVGMCDRIGLKCRDILVWRSGQMLVNAAVMGLFPRLRYVMLSDGLLASMKDRQIEAVFGHEAGHVRHRHIQFFLLFAVGSMLISAGVMEILYRWSLAEDGPRWLNSAVIQGVGFVAIAILWGVGFGFVSRHFERQADLFGARCITPVDAADCLLPCGVHSDATAPAGSRLRLCSTGADIFATALDRVALLNGIPPEEPSWRHSSIASRIAFLRSLASDPTRVESFERRIRRIKRALIVVCVVGLAVSAYYVQPYVSAELERMTSTVGKS